MLPVRYNDLMTTSPKQLLIRAYKPVLRGYFSVRNSWPVWYGILNRDARMHYHKSPPSLNTEGTRLLPELKRDGITVTTLDKLFPNENILESLQTWEQNHKPREESGSKKKFLREYWDLVPSLDFTNPFLRLSLDTRVLAIVSAYMEMSTHLTYFGLCETIPQKDIVPAQSQRWHRDPEEKRMLKMFIYLNDVDRSAGPFTYARRTVYGQEYGHLFPQKPPEGVYPPEKEVLASIPHELIGEMTGSAGTVIFCDTSGLHFGGRATDKHRIMFTAAYHSPAFSEGARYTITDDNRGEIATLPLVAQYALSGKTIRH